MFENSKTGSAWKSTILISEHCEIKGEISFSGELIIHGKIDGNINSQPDSKALVRVQDGGIVNGNIHAPNLIINGTVVGDIHSEKHIELAAKAKVKGTIHYSLMEAVKGSAIEGNLVPSKSLDGDDASADPDKTNSASTANAGAASASANKSSAGNIAPTEPAKAAATMGQANVSAKKVAS